MEAEAVVTVEANVETEAVDAAETAVADDQAVIEAAEDVTAVMVVKAAIEGKTTLFINETT